MAKFTFVRSWSGYVRGSDTVTVEADTMDEAQDKLPPKYSDEGRSLERDDRHFEQWELER